MLPVDMVVYKDYLDIEGKFYVSGNPFLLLDIKQFCHYRETT
jgi:hypothetical protein